MKKFFCIILAITLLMSTFVVLAADEKADFIQNGSFESTEADGTPSNWSLLGDPTHAAIDTKTVSDGKNAIQFKSSTENVTYTQRVDGINGGTEYTLTAYLYAKAIAGSGAQIKLEFYAGDTSLSDVVKESYPDTNRKFEAKVIKFTAPTGATRANVLIRLLGGGEIYWDKVSLIGAGKPVADASGNAEFIQNGGFEQLAEDGSFASWSLLGDATHAMVETQNVHAEERAVHFKSATENVTYTQRVNGICGGSPYVLTAYLHAKSYVGSAQIKIEFYAGDTSLSDVVKESYTDTNRKYEPKVIKFNAPTGATRANVLIRLLGGGDIYWDSVSLVGKLDENASTAAPSTPSAPPAADPAKPQESLETEELLVGYDNLVKNPGFEDVDQTDGYGPWYWNPYKSTTYKDHEKTTWEEKIVRSGAKSIKITNTNPEDNPFVKQTIDVYGGGKYQVGAYFYAEEFGAGGFVTIKVEFYDDANNFLGEGNIRYNGAATQTWTPLVSTFEVPAGVTKMAVLLRLRKGGTIYFDDIQVVSTEKPTPIFIETDEVFYYTDHTDPGYAVATLNSKAYPALASVTAVDMRLKKGDTVLAESLNVPVVDGTASFYYDVALLTEKQTEYKIEVTTSGLVGEALIYKYDRPLYLDARGVYRDASGQVIYPVTAYRYRDYQYEIGNKEGGITVGQLAMPADKEGDALVAYLKDYLDKAVAANTKCMIALYRNGKPAGDPVNIATTELVVAALKDHPGLYAWMVMDETFNNVPNPHDVLRRSYIAIRNNDPYHPVYMCEATTRLVEAGRYCDILCVDPYPGNHDAPEHFPADRVKLAIESVKGRKPVYSLLQCIDFQEYTPTTDELRNMIYQSLLAGADAVGYYKFDDSLETTDLNETHFWDAIKPFAQNEQVDAFKAFVYDEYNIFSDVRNEKAWCISYIKNNEIYMVVQNRTKEAQTLQIPLTSIAGDVTVGDYTATCIAGGNGETVTGNGTLTAQVVKSGVSLYKITPADASVLATIPQTRFHDIREYGWAYNAILRTDAAGIVNGISDDSFFPGQKITRGDFAMFLIRTLGLTADATETFADVNASAHYAKEIAIGKALGILKGVGNDLYMPEAEISRQDLMVICARGMRLKKALEESGDISQFSDAASIADYAVADIAAMTRASIVKGYEDGSIRPLGNTTRAEAAVIMDRIMNWAA